ncbi:MAG: FAD-dependent oxidoreductase [Bacteroidota bacterium]
MNVKTITVIGGGVIGITTAHYLQRIGYQTEVVTHLRADKGIGNLVLPEFASLYAPALIVPHSVEMENLDEVFETSQKEFGKYVGMLGTAVRWQQHYELFANKTVAMPSYAKALHNLVPYGSSRRHFQFEQAIKHEISGWVAECLFVETPVYIPYLFREYMVSGGRIVELEEPLDPGMVKNIRSDLIVNCTGLWSRELFNDNNLYPIRGHLLMIEDAPFPLRPDGLVCSYNYSPPSSEYEYDVYCFPRSAACPPGQRGWILGGSREAPRQTGGELWRVPETRHTLLDGVPEPIVTINRSIMRALTQGANIDDYKRKSMIGYRPGRHGGVRLELVQEFGRPVIHNYGHGGAGVTLSWGCAAKVARLIAYG